MADWQLGCHPERVTDPPLSPNVLGARLAEVFALVGPLYRRAAAVVQSNVPVEHTSMGVRAVLERLATDGPATVSQMARRLELSRQFVQRTVDEATAQSLVGARPNPAHKRSPLIELTTAGQRRINTITARERAVLGTTAGDLTSADIDTSLHVLTNLLEVLR
jgi:DNA-binding MarR family transcriptional regulator